jgi:hypothetical protein
MRATIVNGQRPGFPFARQRTSRSRCAPGYHPQARPLHH